MQVTVRVRSGSTPMAHQRLPVSGTAEELVRIANEFGVTVEPVHPGVQDPQLASYFTVRVPDGPTAERVIQRLRQSDRVEAAYVKPADELP